MFCRVYLPRYVEYFLRSRNANVVRELLAKMAESGAPPCARKSREPCTAWAAVKVEAHERPEAAERSQVRREDRIDIRIAFEDLPKPVFDHDGN